MLSLTFYLTRHMQKVVETSDFRKCLEEVSGRSLVRFFEQWFYSPSFPKVRTSLPSSSFSPFPPSLLRVSVCRRSLTSREHSKNSCIPPSLLPSPQLTGEWDYDEETKIITLTIEQGKSSSSSSDEGEDEDDEGGPPLFDVAFTIEVYNKDGALETTFKPSLTRTTPKVVLQAKVRRSPCYLHVNPQLAAVLTLGTCEREGRENREAQGGKQRGRST